MTHHRQKPSALANARSMRRNMTDAERKLWHAIRNQQLGYRFRRQHTIGPYIADFACIEKMCIIEVDGGQHQDQVVYDEQRTRFLKMNGWQVLRFWNNDVLENLEGVVSVITHALEVPAGKI